MKIKYVNYGLANNFNSYIELHKDLKKYPRLHNFILKHELKHSDKAFSFYDLKHDLNINIPMMIKLLAFTLKRPSTWTDLSPIIYRKHKGFFFDVNLFILYFVLISIILVIII